MGSLDQIGSFVKMLVFVSSDNEFYQQPEVANGATDLLVDIFGEEIGLPARSAIGVNVLPGNIPVEIEVLVELKDK
ncbi:RidA family protein [Dorea formicigenerans]|uniref:RidA family protein n=1 Tax=Dorea formicigenerans TaxID=39486 RepID=UPI001FA9178D|nr:RidA family protein [Dorea formicigenerans]